MDYNTNAFTVTGMCQEAAIYGLDGSAWAWSPGFPELKSYTFPMEGLDGSITNVEVNELQTAIDASKGIRTSGDKGGIRMGNNKFMMIGSYDDQAKLSQLSYNKGGASISLCNTCIIIAFWQKDTPMQPKGF